MVNSDDPTQMGSAELHEARDHLRAVSDSMCEALCTLDDAGSVSYLNAAAERLLGWNAEELRGRTMHAATHHRHPDGSVYPIEECPLYAGHRARMGVRASDDIFVRRDGSDLAVSWVLAPFDSPAGHASVLVFTDNTNGEAGARPRTQSELGQSSQVRDLRDALREERFELFAQPIIDLNTGAIVSHELLLRMRERDGNICAPASFLPVAESSGLIRELDRWVIREAARIAGDGHNVHLNLSTASFCEPGLFDHFTQAVAEHGADPSRMVVEVTETAIMQDATIAEMSAGLVRALGCELALDDFGTGFGGFGYIKRLHVDYLKIDVEFVRDLPTSIASRHVVRAVVSLAKAFGQRTVAEGVEDEETLELLRGMGVDRAQGFWIGRPAPLVDTLYRIATSVVGMLDRGGQRANVGALRDPAGGQRDSAGRQRDSRRPTARPRRPTARPRRPTARPRRRPARQRGRATRPCRRAVRSSRECRDYDGRSQPLGNGPARSCLRPRASFTGSSGSRGRACGGRV